MKVNTSFYALYDASFYALPEFNNCFLENYILSHPDLWFKRARLVSSIFETTMRLMYHIRHAERVLLEGGCKCCEHGTDQNFWCLVHSRPENPFLVLYLEQIKILTLQPSNDQCCDDAMTIVAVGQTTACVPYYNSPIKGFFESAITISRVYILLRLTNVC